MPSKLWNTICSHGTRRVPTACISIASHLGSWQNLAARQNRRPRVSLSPNRPASCGSAYQSCCSRIPAVAHAADGFRFENDILPILSRYGCNSSGCHGKAEGQGGFKLSVFAKRSGIGLRGTYEGRALSVACSRQAGRKFAVAEGHRPRRTRRRNETSVRKRKITACCGDWIAAGMPIGSPDAPRVIALASIQSKA